MTEERRKITFKERLAHWGASAVVCILSLVVGFFVGIWYAEKNAVETYNRRIMILRNSGVDRDRADFVLEQLANPHRAKLAEK